MYMKKQYQSSITKNHKMKKKFFFFDGVPSKGYVALRSQISANLIDLDRTQLLFG